MHIRIKVIIPQRGPWFYADAGEERTVRRDLGLGLIASGAADLVADPWPPVKPAKAAAPATPAAKPAAKARRKS
jgi:hypothetical protein